TANPRAPPVTLTVNAFDPLPVPLATTLCRCDSFDFGGELFDELRTMGDVILPGATVNGCDSTVTVTVNFFDPVPGTLDTTICRGDSFDFGGELFDELRTLGDVILPGATVNGCDSTVMVTVNFFDPVPGTLDTTICRGDSFDFNGELFDELRTMGDVILPGATVNGCDSTVMVTLSFFPAATGSLDTTLCVGESLSVGSEDFDVTRPAGEAVLAAAAANGCDSTIMVTVSFFPAATGQLDSLLCPGESVEVNGEVFDESRRQGDVLLEGASINGCDSTVSVNLSYRTPATITLSGQGRICTGEMLSINLDNSGSDTYNVLLNGVPGPALAVAPGSNSFELDVADGTTLTIASVEQGAAACAPTFGGSITVERSNLVLDLQSLSGSPGFDLSCFDSADGILEVTATGGVEPYTYAWSNGGAGPRLVDLPAGTVSLTVTDAIGCDQIISYDLLAPPALNMEVVGGVASCLDNLGQAQIQRIGGGSEPYLYQINGGVFLPLDAFPQVINQLPGDYSITIQDANGCELSDAFTISPAPESQLFIQPEVAIVQLGDSILLNAQTDATVDSLFWSAAGVFVPGANEIQVWAGPLESTVYSIWLRDLTGCELEAEVLVQVDRNVPIFQPTAFSPNGDGVNDVFLLYFGDGVTQLEDFQIFNRWGDIVHQVGGILDLSSTSWSWDGRQGDQTLNPGVFVYSVRVTYLDGRQEIVAGEVTLVR
ncbi:MAG: gliding motility-associated C-terminal domain-containing protein, partial [Bacteroidota bacterium]